MTQHDEQAKEQDRQKKIWALLDKYEKKLNWQFPTFEKAIGRHLV